MLVATDLDNTIIYPATIQAATDVVAVDGSPNHPLAVMSAAAAALWARLAGARILLPVTGRTNDQYLRLRMPGPPPPIAITLNGAEILIDGVPDARWRRQIRIRIDRASLHINMVVRHLRHLAASRAISSVYLAEDAYCVAILHDHSPDGGIANELTEWAAAHSWKALSHGRDLFLLPFDLDKQHAVVEVAKAASCTIAGGDSWLDAIMLTAASAAIRPAHGALHEGGWANGNCVVTKTSGPHAAEEILRWYAEQACLGDT